MNATTYLTATGRCHGCGCRLTGRHGNHRPRFYCSLTRMRLNPPALVAAAEREGLSPRETLLRTLEGRAVTAAAGMLGVNKQAVYAWLRLYGIRRDVRWTDPVIRGA